MCSVFHPARGWAGLRRLCAAALVAALSLPVAACGGDGEVEVDLQARALRQLAENRSVSGLQAGDPAPRGRKAQALWVTRRGLARMKQLTDSVSGQYGIDVNQLPPAYGTQEYYVNAAGHPEVREYFAQYAAYARDMRENAFPWMQQSLSADLAQTRLGKDFAQGMLRGLESKHRTFRRAMGTAGNAASDMVELHDFLVAIGGRVSYSMTGQLQFESVNDMARVQEMEQRVQAGFREAAEYSARAEQESREQLQAFTSETTRR